MRQMIRLGLAVLLANVCFTFSIKSISNILSAKENDKIEFCLENVDVGYKTGRRDCKRALFEEIEKEFTAHFDNDNVIESYYTL